MNLDFYGLFDYTSGDGDIYEYTASEFNTILKSITGNGVVKAQGDRTLLLDILFTAALPQVERIHLYKPFQQQPQVAI